MFQLNPAPLDNDNPLLDNEKTEKSSLKKSNAKTFKNKKQVNFEDNKTKLTNIADMLSKIDNNDEDSDDENNNFKSEMNNLKKKYSNVKNDYNQLFKSNNYDPTYSDINNINNIENSINTSFANINDGYKSHYDILNLPKKNILEDNNTLLSKLDYIIHLLEEQHDEKTNHITEELILYLFLGIFIIFVLDSFARASKYVR